MSFCRSCGASLNKQGAGKKSATGSSRMPSAADVVGRKTPPSGQPGSSIQCRHCRADTPSGYQFCQLCGKRVAGGADNEIAQAATDPAESSKRPPVPSVKSRPPGVRSIAPGTPGIDANAVAETLAASGEDAAALARQAEDLARRRTIEEDPAVSSTLPETPIGEIGHAPPAPASESGRMVAGTGAWGRLITVKQDGSDGKAYPLGVDLVEIGRAGGGLRFENDRYLAPVHALIEFKDGKATLVPHDRVNGVYRRVRKSVAIADGGLILLGRELARFELVTESEREVQPLVQGGVARFGSPPREPWGRLSFLLPNLGVRDVRYLEDHQFVIGREDGHVVFNDDEFLSRRHAVLRWSGSECTLEDLNSSNGSYVRLDEPTALDHRDYLRLGNQLFRFEVG